MAFNHPQMISERLLEIAAKEPERRLVFDPRHGWSTYGEISQKTKDLAAGLHGLGLGRDDIVLMQLPNWVEFVVAHVALTMIGCVTAYVPINYREHELAGALKLTGAKALLMPWRMGSEDFLPLAISLKRRSEKLAFVVFVGGQQESLPGGMFDYLSVSASGAGRALSSDTLRKLRLGESDLSVLSFTSGTTGDLKGVMLTTEALFAWNQGLIDRYALSERECIFAASPLGHAVGFGHSLRMTFTLGACLVLLDKWEVSRGLDLLSEQQCTYMAGSTPFLMDIVYSPLLEAREKLPSLRLFLCGGATVPEQLIHDARQALPLTTVTPLWGMSECGGVTTCPLDATFLKYCTTDGLPCGTMELKVVDEKGSIVARDTEGELLVRGPMLSQGYFCQPELTKKSFQGDGYFRTGDLARMDADGYIKITGRIKDLIIRGGVNISPVEIENILYSHPKVSNAAVIGLPDKRLGERVCAFLVLAGGESIRLEEMQRWMATKGVAKIKWPERIEVVDSFPLTPSGKVKKFLLKETLEVREKEARPVKHNAK